MKVEFYLNFVREDKWIGLYTKESDYDKEYEKEYNKIYYVCLIPCCVISFSRNIKNKNFKKKGKRPR